MPIWLKSHSPLRPCSLTTTRVSLEVCKLVISACLNVSRSCPSYTKRSLSAYDRLLLSLLQPPKRCAALVLLTYSCELEKWSWRIRAIWLGWWWAGTQSCEPLRSGLTEFSPCLRSAADCFLRIKKIIFLFKRGCRAPVLSLLLWTQGLKAENTPHYKVLFSGQSPSSMIIGYLPQTQLERITGMRVRSKRNGNASPNMFDASWTYYWML